MRESRTVPRPPAVESPRHLPLVDLLIDARSELFELAVRSGLKVLETMLEEDRVALCGARYAHVAERHASRAGSVSSEVVLGGRKVSVRRPRVRAGGHEVPLPTFRAMADVDPLNRRVVEQMLVGVATRRYGRSLEPVPATLRSRGTSKSAVSRRFVAKTAAQLAAWQTATLEALDLVGLLIDGVHIGEHCLIVALGIAADGQKHALAYGTARRRPRGSVRTCWPIGRAAAFAPTGVCSSSSTARRRCAKRSGPRSGRRHWCSAAKSIRPATSSTT